MLTTLRPVSSLTWTKAGLHVLFFIQYILFLSDGQYKWKSLRPDVSIYSDMGSSGRTLTLDYTVLAGLILSCAGVHTLLLKAISLFKMKQHSSESLCRMSSQHVY